MDRPTIIKRLAVRHATRAKKQNAKKLRSLFRKEIRKPRDYKIIAYDLETTRIAAGTPEPLYITAYGDDGFYISKRIQDMKHLCDILEANFLREHLSGARFIAWNGNKFDAYFIGAALLNSDKYIIHPYLTASNSLRGFRVQLKEDEKIAWEFLDGMAMTGIQRNLDTFLKTFAPDYQKSNAPDWAHEEFDPHNLVHVKYAERDSEGLYYAMVKANAIVKEHFSIPLQPTIGNCGIKIFSAHIPHGCRVAPLPQDAEHIVRTYVMRGGFCYAARKYEGPVWKYDINQAYAAAMREAPLPAGTCYYLSRGTDSDLCGMWRVTAAAPAGNLIPFYHRDHLGNSAFSFDGFTDVWITSSELAQLKAEGWRCSIRDGYWWDNQFQMAEYIDKLEALRVNGPGGPKSAQGEMMKAIGNNSYGKTVEVLNGLEIVMALQCPPDFSAYQNADDRLQHLWFRLGEPAFRDYHQPHIGAFITAHVRMQVRRAALLAPADWLYADTDCCIFSRKPEGLDIDPTRYGAWKVEEENVFYRIITKKVYANGDASEKHAKGMNIKSLTSADFENWFNGQAPEQTQTQRQNFLKAMVGDEMFITRQRRGAK